MNSKYFLYFGIYSTIFGLYSTEYAPSVSDEIREQHEQKQYYNQDDEQQQQYRNISSSSSLVEHEQEQYHHEYDDKYNRYHLNRYDDDRNGMKQQQQQQQDQHPKHKQMKVSLDETNLIISPSLSHNKTEFATTSNERSSFATIASAPTHQLQDGSIFYISKSPRNTTESAVTKSQTKTKKNRGKRKKIKGKFNNKNKLKSTFKNDNDSGDYYSNDSDSSRSSTHRNRRFTRKPGAWAQPQPDSSLESGNPIEWRTPPVASDSFHNFDNERINSDSEVEFKPKKSHLNHKRKPSRSHRDFLYATDSRNSDSQTDISSQKRNHRNEGAQRNKIGNRKSVGARRESSSRRNKFNDTTLTFKQYTVGSANDGMLDNDDGISKRLPTHNHHQHHFYNNFKEKDLLNPKHVNNNHNDFDDNPDEYENADYDYNKPTNGFEYSAPKKFNKIIKDIINMKIDIDVIPSGDDNDSDFDQMRSMHINGILTEHHKTSNLLQQYHTKKENSKKNDFKLLQQQRRMNEHHRAKKYHNHHVNGKRKQDKKSDNVIQFASKFNFSSMEDRNTPTPEDILGDKDLTDDGDSGSNVFANINEFSSSNEKDGFNDDAAAFIDDTEVGVHDNNNLHKDMRYSVDKDMNDFALTDSSYYESDDESYSDIAASKDWHNTHKKTYKKNRLDESKKHKRTEKYQNRVISSPNDGNTGRKNKNDRDNNMQVQQGFVESMRSNINSEKKIVGNVNTVIDTKYNLNKNRYEKSKDIAPKKDYSGNTSNSNNRIISSNNNNRHRISDGVSQEDFITSQHSVEKLMEITSIEKDMDAQVMGDLSCFKDNDFQPAPEIPHADIKYLRNEENGIENSFLEVEYICHNGFELQMANDDNSGSKDNRRNVFCKNNSWIGAPPFCVKADNDAATSQLETKRKMERKEEQSKVDQYRPNKTCSHPEKCDQLCNVENGIEICSCRKGFQSINGQCEDINECRLRNEQGPCQDICINTHGSYKCSCDNIPGSQLNNDGRTCIEIDECSQNNGGCSHTCIHTMGRAYCLCPEGYTLDKDWKTCVDIDECAEQASDDSSELRCEFGCINTPGSYTCLIDFGAEQSIYEETLTECADGFYHNSSTADCEDVNECADKNGGCLHRCFNTFGSYYCSCLPGYHIDGDMKSCVAPLQALGNKNATDGVVISCPPLFPPKHGYLECSRPLAESEELLETNGNYYGGYNTNDDAGYSNNHSRSNDTRKSITNDHIDLVIASNNGSNISTIGKTYTMHKDQQQLHVTTNHPGSQCVLRCPTGFRINGNFSQQCSINGKWIGDNDGICIRYPTPKLICPSDIRLETPPSEKMAKLKIPRPRTDVNFERDVTISPAFLKTTTEAAFEIGSRNVTYTAENPVSKLSISCSFAIIVVEGESPTVKYCPGTQKYSLEKQHESIKVNWKEPIFHDNINVTEISKTNTPGNNFGVGSHQIVYVAKDEAGYSARCIFKVIVNVPPQQDALIHPLPFYRMFYKK